MQGKACRVKMTKWLQPVADYMTSSFYLSLPLSHTHTHTHTRTHARTHTRTHTPMPETHTLVDLNTGSLLIVFYSCLSSRSDFHIYLKTTLSILIWHRGLVWKDFLQLQQSIILLGPNQLQSLPFIYSGKRHDQKIVLLFHTNGVLHSNMHVAGVSKDFHEYMFQSDHHQHSYMFLWPLKPAHLWFSDWQTESVLCQSLQGSLSTGPEWL